MKFRDLLKLIESDGWRFDRQRGSHMQYRHPHKMGTLTVAAGGKMSNEVPKGTMNQILKLAGLKKGAR